MILDLQILTIFSDIKKTVPKFTGNVLDIGCGDSPYKFLLNEQVTKYYGIDIVDADKFDYKNSDITPFNGEDIPFPEEMFNAVICTEVLEHVEKYQKLVDECYRVMNKGATGIFTIPWSARYHYIPWDYFRYTPSSLKTIFKSFDKVAITPRGTDVVVICSKIIVLFYRNLLPAKLYLWLLLPIWICLIPFLILTIIIAHLALWLNMGTNEDPLGYTVTITK